MILRSIEFLLLWAASLMATYVMFEWIVPA